MKLNGCSTAPPLEQVYQLATEPARPVAKIVVPTAQQAKSSDRRSKVSATSKTSEPAPVAPRVSNVPSAQPALKKGARKAIEAARRAGEASFVKAKKSVQGWQSRYSVESIKEDLEEVLITNGKAQFLLRWTNLRSRIDNARRSARGLRRTRLLGVHGQIIEDTLLYFTRLMEGHEEQLLRKCQTFGIAIET